MAGSVFRSVRLFEILLKAGAGALSRGIHDRFRRALGVMVLASDATLAVLSTAFPFPGDQSNRVVKFLCNTLSS